MLNALNSPSWIPLEDSSTTELRLYATNAWEIEYIKENLDRKDHSQYEYGI